LLVQGPFALAIVPAAVEQGWRRSPAAVAGSLSGVGQDYLKLPNGRALTGQSQRHDYKRHGTTTLFAAI
jgi:hypothetical protein